MVQRGYVKCPTCGKLYQLKIQVDQNVHIFEWPISFGCVECGDNLNFKYTNHGFFPKESCFLPSPKDKPITTIGYSSSLPITDDLYMKDLDYTDSLALSSPFINLSTHGHFTLNEIGVFDSFLKRLQMQLLPYRNLLATMLPILKKANIKAFNKKLADFLGDKNHTSIYSTQEMYDVFFGYLEQSYHFLISPYYNTNYYNRYVKPLKDWIITASVGDVKALKTKLDESGKLSLWYKEEALPYITDMLAKVHKLIPAMIYVSVGVSNVKQRGDLKIVTISCKEATDIYQEGYELFVHGMKVFVGLNNLVENGDIDSFTNSKLGDVDTLTKFAKKPGGKMLEHIENYVTITDYLDGSINNKIRNAASHKGVDYDALTQRVRCYYDDSDSKKVYDTTLIEICRHCYIQLLHLIEATLLSRMIVEKAK